MAHSIPEQPDSVEIDGRVHELDLVFGLRSSILRARSVPCSSLHAQKKPLLGRNCLDLVRKRFNPIRGNY